MEDDRGTFVVEGSWLPISIQNNDNSYDYYTTTTTTTNDNNNN